MKTRIIQTSFWEDVTARQMPKDARYLFMYLLTNPRINMCGIYEISDLYLTLETALTPIELQKAKNYLQQLGRAYFYEGWVKIVNAEKHNNYKNSPKNEAIYKNEIDDTPIVVKEYFDTTINGGGIVVSDTSDTTHKSKTRNLKPENKYISLSSITPEDIEQIASDYKVPASLVNFSYEALKNYCTSKGKTYRDYKAALRNFVLKEAKNQVERRDSNGKRAIDASQL